MPPPREPAAMASVSTMPWGFGFGGKHKEVKCLVGVRQGLAGQGSGHDERIRNPFVIENSSDGISGPAIPHHRKYCFGIFL